MQVRKFTARDMRQVLKLVRESLGEDAAILSSRSLAEGGVEVVATRAEKPTPPSGQGNSNPSNVSQAEFGAMRSELNSIRSLLQQRLNGMAWEQFERQTPAQATVWERFSTMGLPAPVIRQLMSQIKDSGSAEKVSDLWRKALTAMVKSLPVLGFDPIVNGGVYAFLGPTGAGKTTTIAKLATQYVLAHGPDEVALVTTDSFRLASHEQLRALARILGVTVRIVDNHHSLSETLASLEHKSLVLIDTAGLPAAHAEQARQIESLRSQPGVRKWLVLPATAQGPVLEAAWRNYGRADVVACVLSHVDEACLLGDALALSIMKGLPVVYETFGQSIPDDIAVAKAPALVKKAIDLGRVLASEPVDKDRLMQGFATESNAVFRAGTSAI